MRKTQMVTDRELEIMKILWARSRASVREVQEDLNRTAGPVAYSTVQTLLNIMEDKKGLVRHVVEGRTFVYIPKKIVGADDRRADQAVRGPRLRRGAGPGDGRIARIEVAHPGGIGPAARDDRRGAAAIQPEVGRPRAGVGDRGVLTSECRRRHPGSERDIGTSGGNTVSAGRAGSPRAPTPAGRLLSSGLDLPGIRDRRMSPAPRATRTSSPPITRTPPCGPGWIASASSCSMRLYQPPSSSHASCWRCWHAGSRRVGSCWRAWRCCRRWRSSPSSAWGRLPRLDIIDTFVESRFFPKAVFLSTAPIEPPDEEAEDAAARPSPPDGSPAAWSPTGSPIPDRPLVAGCLAA